MSSGQVLPKGGAQAISPDEPQHPANIVEMGMTPSGVGYWMTTPGGHVSNSSNVFDPSKGDCSPDRGGVRTFAKVTGFAVSF